MRNAIANQDVVAPGTLHSRRLALPVAVLIFLVGAFFYVWFRVEPLLEYHTYGPYLFRQRAFVETFLRYPGGLVSYAGVALAQLNFSNALGALVFVVTEALVFVATLVCLVRIRGKSSGFAALLPLFLLLALRNHYGWPVPAMGLGLLLAMGATAGLISVRWRKPWSFCGVSGLISAAVFLLAGLWPALLFAVLCSLFVLIQLRSFLPALGCVMLALGVPLLALKLGNLRVAGLINPWQQQVNWILPTVLYASVPVVATVLALMPKADARPACWSRLQRFGEIAAVLAFLLGWAAVWLTFDRRQKHLAEIDYATSRGQYDAVLSAAHQVKALNDPAKTRVELALYHTGRLAEELFSFYNMTEDAPAGTGEECRAQSQLLFELGLINDAEHIATEALVIEGERPDLLRLLARINFLKNRPQAAQIFLNVLSLIPFQGQRANDTWPAMDTKTLRAECAFPGRMPATVLTNDVLHDGLPVGQLLDVVLTLNPKDQMAFECVMAAYLLDLDLEKVVEHLQLLDNFKYDGIPRPYEEAILLLQELEGVQVQLKGRMIRSQTVERFQQFKQAARELKGRPDGRAIMAASFGDTYWYYYASRKRERPAEGQASTP